MPTKLQFVKHHSLAAAANSRKLAALTKVFSRQVQASHNLGLIFLATKTSKQFMFRSLILSLHR
jgi:hypothetical protein